MMQMFKTICLFCGGLLILLPLLAGCGGPAKVHEANREPASGMVTFDGKPLGGGSITFISAKDAVYRMTAMIRADGHFLMNNAPSGEVIVSVETETAKIGNPSGYVPIPAKYNNPKTSGLTAVVGKDEAGGSLKFDLKSK